MNELIATIKEARKKRLLFGEKPLFLRGSPELIERDLNDIEKDNGFSFPKDIKTLLVELSPGSIEDLYISNKEMIYPFDDQAGPIAGYVTFLTDILGNHFAFNPKGRDPSEIYYISHDPIGFGIVAKDIEELLASFISNEFDIMEVTDQIDFQELNF